jgi:hypothetical protein
MHNTSPIEHGGNRLKIAHLLLWITTTAFFLSIARLEIRSWETVQPETAQEAFRNWLRITVMLATAPIAGAGISAVALAVYRWLTGGLRFPSQPGHVLLLAIGIPAFVSSGFYILELAIPSVFRFLRSGPAGQMADLAMHFGPPAATAIAIVWMSYREHFPLRWQLTLYLSSASLVAVFAWVACMYVFAFYAYRNWSIGVASGVAILCAGNSASIIALSTTDLMTRHRYDVFHWAGIVGWPVLLASLLISYWY